MKKSAPTQLEFGFVRWGGKRRGAGRKPKGAHAGVAHDTRARLSGREPVSVTLRFVEGLLSLRAMSAESRDDDSTRRQAVSELDRYLGPPGSSPAPFLGARRKRRRRSRAGARRSQGRARTSRERARVSHEPRLRRALVYVLNNARKHGSWIAPWPDPYSSGPSLDGWRAPARGAVSSSSASAELDSRATKASVARSIVEPLEVLGAPRTWLLAVGWRRLGLIDVCELPARARQGTETVA